MPFAIFNVNQRRILFFKKILPAQTELGDAYVTEAADTTSDTFIYIPVMPTE